MLIWRVSMRQKVFQYVFELIFDVFKPSIVLRVVQEIHLETLDLFSYPHYPIIVELVSVLLAPHDQALELLIHTIFSQTLAHVKL